MALFVIISDGFVGIVEDCRFAGAGRGLSFALSSPSADLVSSCVALACLESSSDARYRTSPFAPKAEPLLVTHARRFSCREYLYL